MDKKRFESIKVNVNIRCTIANISGIGITSRDKEELELIDEIERLNKELRELKDQFTTKENIRKEIREKLINSKEYKMANEMGLTSKMSILIELLEMLDKDITKKSDYNYEKVEKENKE